MCYRNIFSMFIISLSVTDILSAFLSAIAWYRLTYGYYNWSIGNFMCKVTAINKLITIKKKQIQQKQISACFFFTSDSESVLLRLSFDNYHIHEDSSVLFTDHGFGNLPWFLSLTTGNIFYVLVHTRNVFLQL